MDGVVFMEYLNLIFNNPFALVAIISLAANFFLVRESYKLERKIAGLDKSVKDRDENNKSLNSEVKALQKDHDKAISDIQKEHKDVVDKLNSQIRVLNEKFDDKHDIVIPSFKSHW